MKSFRPASLEDVRDIIQTCLSDSTRLSIKGQGTKSGLGNPVIADAEMHLGAMSGIVTYEPEELILVARTGTSLADIEALLAKHNQMLSFEPFHPQHVYGGTSSGTIGGMVATGLSGPRRIAAGGVRDYLLGFNAVSGRGDIFQSGSRVMKNVTGYDLSKLMAGSFGTLAIMDEITLKVLPAPETSISLVVDCPSIDMAQSACSAAFASAYEPTGASILPRDIAQKAGLETKDCLAIIRLEGVPVSVSDRQTQMETLLKPFGEIAILAQEKSQKLWQDIKDVAFFDEQDEPIWKISVAPTSCPDIVQAATDLQAKCFMDWAGGLIWIAGQGADFGAKMRKAVSATGSGHATLMRASDALRGEVSVFQPQADALEALHSRIRGAFDPRQLLNPGRMGA